MVSPQPPHALTSPSPAGPRWCWGTSSRRKGGGKGDFIPLWPSHRRGAKGLAKLAEQPVTLLSPCRRSSLVITTKIFWGGK